MADKDTPNRPANKDKAEGERWRSDPDAVPDSESSTSRSYTDDGDNAGGQRETNVLLQDAPLLFPGFAGSVGVGYRAICPGYGGAAPRVSASAPPRRTLLGCHRFAIN